MGQTVVIGYLDKGGKWRKRDWYTKLTDEDKNRTFEKDGIYIYIYINRTHKVG